MEKMHEAVSSALELNAEQQHLFDAMRDSKSREDRRARVDMHKELRTLARQENFDEDNAVKLAEAIGSEASQKAYQHAAALHRFYQSLSIEQRKRFDEIHDARESKRQEKHQDKKHKMSQHQ
jgi:Spy/CpxP family protein refolding chaperone